MVPSSTVGFIYLSDGERACSTTIDYPCHRPIMMTILELPAVKSMPVRGVTAMPVSLYQASVPGYIRQLNGLSAIIHKATGYCAERKIDPAALLHARLYPDMFTLLHQVRLACNHAERGVCRLTGTEPPTRENNEATFEDLVTRIATAIAFVKSADAKKMVGMEDRDITFPVGPNQMTLKGVDYLIHFSMPNFYFHVTTAYNILRHNGLQIGKQDFLGGQ
jgi:uncharacterized protein